MRPAFGDGDVRTHRANRLGEVFDARFVSAEAFGARQRGDQPFGTHPVSSGKSSAAHFEGLESVLVVGRHEDDGRGIVPLCQMTRHLDAVHVRHVDVEQHDVGIQPVDLLKSVDATAGLAHQLQRDLLGAVAQNLSEARSRRGSSSTIITFSMAGPSGAFLDRQVIVSSKRLRLTCVSIFASRS